MNYAQMEPATGYKMIADSEGRLPCAEIIEPNLIDKLTRKIHLAIEKSGLPIFTWRFPPPEKYEGLVGSEWNG